MKFAILPLHYLWWHYTLALRDLTVVSGNLLWFIYRFFSLPSLVKTLFSPWRRLGEGYRRGFNPQAFLETLVVNTLMRIVGVIFRLVMIAVGLMALVVAILVGILFFIFWFLLPPLILILATAGVWLMIKT